MKERPDMWRTILKPRSLKIFLISFLFHPPLITLLGASFGIVSAHQYTDSVVPFILAGLPFAIAGSFFLYAIPATVVSLFIIACPLFYDLRNAAVNSILLISSVSFGAFFGVISGFQTLSILAGALLGAISTLVALIATKNLRAGDYSPGDVS